MTKARKVSELPVHTSGYGSSDFGEEPLPQEQHLSSDEPVSVVFFGSGPVAAMSLELLAEDYTVEAVITKPKPPHHKGSSPVIEVAKKLNLALHTPASKTELADIMPHLTFSSHLGVVIDYGIIIPSSVINKFPLGIVNSHFSLLPEWRGADPITFSILSGQKQTGISLMLITEGLDEGPLLAQATLDIAPDATTPELTDELIRLSDHALKETLPLYINGDAIPGDQLSVTISEQKTPTYSRKLTKQDGIIDWQKPAQVIEREIRAFIEWPKSRAVLAGKDVIITSAKVINKQGEAGHVAADKEGILVFCKKDALKIERLKPAGKKEMTAQDFLRGNKV